MTFAEAHVREADPDLADDRARPRALHPLLPLHALLARASPRTASSSRRTAAPQSVIATFEDEPYRAPFSGNVIELCPVGALTSTQYRFEARPWEIQNVPTVCGLCPVGCNIYATTREGKVKRILSRNHPEVDEGWLCDKGRFAFPHLYARDRITDPLRRAAPAAGSRRSRGTTRSTRPSGCCATPTGRIVTALSGSETVEQAYALARLLRARARRARRRAAGGDEPGARRLPAAALGDPRRRARRRPRRRAGRRARADRRPLDQGRPPHRRRGRTTPATRTRAARRLGEPATTSSASGSARASARS